MVLLVIAYFLLRPQKRIPPPEVTLKFLKFVSQGTNTYAVISFSNLGDTEVCLWDSIQLWQLVAKTPKGWVTNMNRFATVVGEGIPRGSNKVFRVPLASGTTEWQIKTIYGFQEHEGFATKFSGWVWGSQLVQRGSEPVVSAVSWCLDLLPDSPPLTQREVRTPFLTNIPPVF